MQIIIKVAYVSFIHLLEIPFSNVNDMYMQGIRSDETMDIEQNLNIYRESKYCCVNARNIVI